VVSRLSVLAVLEREAVGQEPGEAVTASTRLVNLPGRGTTRIWECSGPPGAETLMLIHGVTFTAELNWAKVWLPLSRHFRVIALDLRGHGDGISAGPKFCLEDCADDVAALAEVLGIGRFIAVGYSMGGMIAQLVYRRHGPMVTGLVLCATARNVLGSPADQLGALALPAAALTIQWNPMLQFMGAEMLGMALLGPVGDPATARWARSQFSRTKLTTALSAIEAVCEFTSHAWIGQVKVPTAVIVTSRDRTVAESRQLKLADAIPGASVHILDADHDVCVTAPELFAPVLLRACLSVTHASEAQEPFVA